MRHVILLTCILFSVYFWLIIGQTPCGQQCFDRAQMIVDGTEQAPFAYRILSPAIVVGMGNTYQAHFAFYAVGLALFFILLDAWLKRWHVPPLALALVALMLPVMFEAWYLSTYTLVEWILVLAALLLAKPRWYIYALLVIVGTLNREMTGVLLVLIWFGMHPARWRQGILFAGLLVTTYALVRWSVGEREVVLSLMGTFYGNIDSWRTAPAVMKNMLFVPLWVGVGMALRQPHPLRRVFIVASVVYVPAFLVGAMWHEVRLLMPLVILALPLVFGTNKNPGTVTGASVSLQRGLNHVLE